MQDLCYLNGRVVEREHARIDPQDRGFLFGDALYEVIKVVEGTILHLEPHLRRIISGLETIEIPTPPELGKTCSDLVAVSELDTGYLYLQVTRGVAPRGHLPPRDVEPTVLVMPYLYDFPKPAARPSRVITVPDWRWEFRGLKTTSLMAAVVGKLRAREAEVDEVLFRSAKGDIREGGSTNVFVVTDGVLETHPADGTILDGVTRRLVIDLALRETLEVREVGPRTSDADRWQEGFLCGTLTGIQPLVEVDERPIGNRQTGPITARLADALERLEHDLLTRR